MVRSHIGSMEFVNVLRLVADIIDLIFCLAESVYVIFMSFFVLYVSLLWYSLHMASIIAIICGV